MTSLRIFKQVPRLLFGFNTIDRINELLPKKITEIIIFL